jgi:hypothetical protein
VHDRLRCLVVELADHGELARAAGVHAGTHSPPRARSAAPDARSSSTPVQGSQARAVTANPPSRKMPVASARYSGR